MREDDQVGVMILVTAFTGTAFWPVLLGWVDVGTLAGWMSLISMFSALLVALGAFSALGALGFLAVHLIVSALVAARIPWSAERAAARILRQRSYRAADALWKAAWLAHARLRRRSP